MSSRFVHLHLHTEYSLSDGLLRIEPLLSAAAAAEMPALAITDQGNFFGAIKFYRTAQQYGIKPILGAELWIKDERCSGHNGHSSRLVLLCQDQLGYHNLIKLITRSYVDGQSQGVPYVLHSWLDGATEGLIALSAARAGDIGQALIHNNNELAKTLLAEWAKLFPERFYIELQRSRRQDEDLYIAAAIELATRFEIPVVASNDVRFLSAEDFDAHEARVCIQQGRTLADPRRPRPYSPEQYLKSAAEMAALFQDLPEALENSMLIAQRCNVELGLGEYYLPDFPVPEGHDQDSWLRHEAEAGLAHILAAHHDKAATPLMDEADFDAEYKQRLETELDVISGMGFPGYFLIVADFIRWAKEHDIPVGPGRGSGAGSLVAYALGVTELDPIKYDLLFERFLNPERVSLPDFDVDFCMEGRDQVIDYVAGRYGRAHVSQIITYGSMAAKAAVRDVGRVLGHPYGFVDQIAKLIPFDIEMTLARAMDEEATLRQRYQDEEEVAALIDLAQKLEGLARNAGRHPGGLVIAPKPLTEYTPLYCEQGSTVTSTQFDMHDVESVGLVKFDFLGLRTLTIIDWAVKDVIDVLNEQIDIRKIPLDDAATYSLIRRMDTTAIFQLESEGIKKLIRRLKPDSFDDLIALVALFRPGPLQSGMVDDYIERKHGRAEVGYPHPALADILQPTYGVILYQEQVMQIAQVLAGYTLAAADLLRRAMGKKKPEEMAKQRSIFTKGAVANDVKERVATHIFDLMEKFAGYGFNKSHSAAYALLAYQTAWLKTHYPAAFMAAVLSADMHNTDKIVVLRDELRRMRLRLLAPTINRSELKFKVVDDQTIGFGLGAIKGVGRAAMENILGERDANGAFSDLFQLCRRIDTRKANKGVLEALIHSGAMDELGPSRSIMLASLDKAVQFAEQFTTNSNAGQDDMFGLMSGLKPAATDAGPEEDVKALPYVIVEDRDEHDRLAGEKQTLGFYLNGHPITRYEQELAAIVSRQLRDIGPGRATIAGYIENIRTRSGARGKMAEVRLDDRTARIHMTLYSEDYQRYRDIVRKDQLIIAKGEAREDDYFESGYSFVAKELFTLDDIRTRAATLELSLDKDMIGRGLLAQLKELLYAHPSGENTVIIEYNSEAASGRFSVGADWKIRLNEHLLGELRDLIGEKNIKVAYPARLAL